MSRLRIYIDTSVIGGCLDPEFAEPSVRLFERFRSRRDTAVLSTATTRELEGAPQAVRRIVESLPTGAVEWLTETEEVTTLADAFVAARVVPEGCEGDALHIAYATVHGVDVLVSWNFKHMVNLTRIRKYNALSLLHGYRALEIRTPLEILYAR